jgi:DMSO/TMAO reductase YedYZ molybdopterin-dependent catalytic subunit
VARDREKIFRLIETADNFVKYAAPGGEVRAEARAKKRYLKAQRLAEQSGDDELAEQVRLRLGDLERRSTLAPSDRDAGGDDEPITAEPPEHAADRVPPGQRVVRGWPVLHEGRIPRFDESSWSFGIDGACANESTLSYSELQDIGPREMTSDFHCVTGWSKLGNHWLGVPTKELLARAIPDPNATHVLVHAEQGYTANVPLEVLQEDESMLAWGHNGKQLAPKHGWPLRLVVPRLYGWKSVKWVRRFELLTADQRGFWEVRGYHNRADPWLEERYSYQEVEPA